MAVTASAPCGTGPDTRADPATKGGSLIGSGRRVAAWDVVTVTTPAGATPCSVNKASLVDALNEQGKTANTPESAKCKSQPRYSEPVLPRKDRGQQHADADHHVAHELV